MARYLLGVDGGSTTVKAALYDLQGNLICMHAEESEPIFPHQGWVEYDLGVFR